MRASQILELFRAEGGGGKDGVRDSPGMSCLPGEFLVRRQLDQEILQNVLSIPCAVVGLSSQRQRLGGWRDGREVCSEEAKVAGAC